VACHAKPVVKAQALMARLVAFSKPLLRENSAKAPRRERTRENRKHRPDHQTAPLFQQTHYARHDKEKTEKNARRPRDSDEHLQATMTRLVQFSKPLLREIRAKAPQHKPTRENHQNRASHHKQNDFAVPTAGGESHEADRRHP
jgi:hypothetical protein